MLGVQVIKGKLLPAQVLIMCFGRHMVQIQDSPELQGLELDL